MRKLLIGLVATLSALVPLGAAHAVTHTSQYWICHTPSLKAVWQYPTGSYWQTQITQFPDYYSAHNAQYLAKYGC